MHSLNFSFCLLCAAAFTLVSCSPKLTPVKTEQAKIISNVTIGEGLDVAVPGQWASSSVNKLTNQYFIKSQDSSLVSISVNPITKYPFYSEGMADSTFVNELFLWESGHFAEQGFLINIVNKDLKRGFILWDITKNEKTVKMLYGKKRMEAIAVNFLESKTYSPSAQNELLMEVFTNYSAKVLPPK